MSFTSNVTRSAAALACIALANCAGTQPVAYRELGSATYLRPNPQDASGRIPYRYTSQTNYSAYTSVIVDPVTIYRGTDGQFDGLSENDEATLASTMQTEFTNKLRQRFTIVRSPAPGTLRVKLTLSGAETNTPVLSAFTHIDMGGNAINAVQAARGRQGVMAGSVSYAVEVLDAPSDRLLEAYVTKQYPNALNIGSSFGVLSASQNGIEKGAELLLKDLQGR